MIEFRWPLFLYGGRIEAGASTDVGRLSYCSQIPNCGRQMMNGISVKTNLKASRNSICLSVRLGWLVGGCLFVTMYLIK